MGLRKGKMKTNKDFWKKTFMTLRRMGHVEDRIREALHKLGLSQTEMAEKVGMTPRAYNNYIAGIRRDRKKQQRIARAWQIPAKVFFADTYKKRKK